MITIGSYFIPIPEWTWTDTVDPLVASVVQLGLFGYVYQRPWRSPGIWRSAFWRGGLADRLYPHARSLKHIDLRTSRPFGPTLLSSCYFLSLAHHCMSDSIAMSIGHY